MKVAHVTDSLGFGGVETWLLNLASFSSGKELSNMVGVIILTGVHDGPLKRDFEKFGVKIIRIPFQKGRLLQFAREFRKVIRDEQVDIVHNHQDWVSGLHWLLTFRLKVVRVSHLHNPKMMIDYYISHWRRIDRRGYYLLGTLFQCLMSDAIYSTSQRVLREYGWLKRMNPFIPVKAMYCGIPRKTSPTNGNALFSCNAPFVLFVGRLSMTLGGAFGNQKNPHFAFSVMNEVFKRDDSVQFVVCGETDAEASRSCMELISPSFEDRVHILGPRRDVRMMMRHAKCLILPSIQEGLGLVAVEAQFEGCPVFCSLAVPDEAKVSDNGFVQLPLIEQHWVEGISETVDQKNVVVQCWQNCHMDLETSSQELLRAYQNWIA